MNIYAKSECDALYYHIYIHAYGLNHHWPCAQIHQRRPDKIRNCIENELPKRLTDWPNHGQTMGMCVHDTGTHYQKQKKNKTEVKQTWFNRIHSRHRKMLKTYYDESWIEKETMRIYVRRNANKFMQRRGYHKLLNKQLIFKTISNTWKQNRTEPNQTGKRNKLTTMNKPKFWRWCYDVWNVHCLLYLRVWFCVSYAACFKYAQCLFEISFQSAFYGKEEKETLWKCSGLLRRHSEERSKWKQKVIRRPNAAHNIADRQVFLFVFKDSHVLCSIMQ